ncbi:MAG: hypothetical protein FWG93_08675 [Oscillospiraceae bacterium]|nr:hypothetical protein [Oscillospiraceae bacterium]
MLQNEPDPMKELHAIRVRNFEQTRHLSPEERSRLRLESVLPVAERYGFRIVSKPNRRMSGNGYPARENIAEH